MADIINTSAVSGTITTTALVLPDNIDRVEWETLGAKLTAAAKWTRWAIGDWLNFGERTWGDTYKRAAEITGYSIGELRNMASLAAQVSERSDALTWSHHKECQALPPERRQFFIGEAEKNEWTTRELRDAIRSDAPRKALPDCKVCGGFRWNDDAGCRRCKEYADRRRSDPSGRAMFIASDPDRVASDLLRHTRAGDSPLDDAGLRRLAEGLLRRLDRRDRGLHVVDQEVAVS